MSEINGAETNGRDELNTSRRVLQALLSASVGFSIVAFGFLATFTLLALDFGSEARRAPLTVGVPATLAALLLVVAEFRTRWQELGTGSPRPTTAVATENQTPEETMDSSRIRKMPDAETDGARQETKLTTVGALGWVLLSLLLFALFGLYLTAVVFTLLFAKTYGKEPWWIALSFATGAYLVFWLIFAELLDVSVYSGLLF